MNSCIWDGTGTANQVILKYCGMTRTSRVFESTYQRFSDFENRSHENRSEFRLLMMDFSFTTNLELFAKLDFQSHSSGSFSAGLSCTTGGLVH